MGDEKRFSEERRERERCRWCVGGAKGFYWRRDEGTKETKPSIWARKIYGG
jgi:hypothetical protein